MLIGLALCFSFFVQFFLQCGLTGAERLDQQRPLFHLGIILYPWDLPGMNWPARAAEVGINTIAFHAAHRLDVLATFARSDEGQAFVAQSRQLGIQVEYELHAFADLLSRELYYKDSSLFRVERQIAPV